MRAASVAGLTAVLAMAGFGLAAAQDDKPRQAKQDLPYMRDPDWIRRPTPEEVYAAWPKGVKTSGSARIACIVTVAGTLRACEVVDENPVGSGYGGAALSVAAQFVMKPAVSDGKVVEGQVIIPVTFDCKGFCESMGSYERLRPILRGLYWLRAPTYQDIAAAYPKGALRKETGGVASVQCRITDKLTLSRCTVMNVEPGGEGFGPVAARLAEKFGDPINPPVSGKMSGSLVRIRFTFTPQMVTASTRLVEHPRWLSRPSESDLQAVRRQLGGRVEIRCSVVAQGALADCRVESSDAAKAATEALYLPLMSQYQMATWTDEGLPTVGGTVLLGFGTRGTTQAKSSP